MKKTSNIILLALCLMKISLSGQAILNFPKEKDKATYRILLTGELKDVVGKKSAINSNIATGSFGISRSSSVYDLSVLLKVADNQQTSQNNYGYDILNPSGLESTAGTIDVTIHDMIRVFSAKKNLGLKAYSSVSSKLWEFQDSESDLKTQLQATILSFGVGVNAALFPEENINEDTEISSHLFVGGNFRYVSGDIGLVEHDELRKRVLGTDTLFFGGPEVYFDIGFNGIKGFADITYFIGTQIRGLGKLQFTVGIGIQADIIKFKTKNDPSSSTNVLPVK